MLYRLGHPGARQLEHTLSPSDIRMVRDSIALQRLGNSSLHLFVPLQSVDGYGLSSNLDQLLRYYSTQADTIQVHCGVWDVPPRELDYVLAEIESLGFVTPLLFEIKQMFHPNRAKEYVHQHFDTPQLNTFVFLSPDAHLFGHIPSSIHHLTGVPVRSLDRRVESPPELSATDISFVTNISDLARYYWGDKVHSAHQSLASFIAQDQPNKGSKILIIDESSHTNDREISDMVNEDGSWEIYFLEPFDLHGSFVSRSHQAW